MTQNINNPAEDLANPGQNVGATEAAPRSADGKWISGGKPNGLMLAGAGSLLAVLAFLGGTAVGHAWGSSSGGGTQQGQFGGPGGGGFGQGQGQGQGNQQGPGTQQQNPGTQQGQGAQQNQVPGAPNSGNLPGQSTDGQAQTT
jgi:hypothetical protein